MISKWLCMVALGPVAGSFLWNAQVRADDLIGAAALVEKLKSTAPKPIPTTTPTTDDTAHVAKDLAQFSKEVDSLAPAEAAKQWLSLFDRTSHLREDLSQVQLSGGMMQSIFQALPGPVSWPDLQKLTEAGTSQVNPWRHAVKVLVVHTLNNDEEKQWADLAAMESLAKTLTGPDAGHLADVLNLGAKLSSFSARPDDAEAFWNRILGELDKAPDNSAAAPTDALGGDINQVYAFPDLVTLLGATKAEPLISHALLLPATTFSFAGVETSKAARKIALAHIDQLKVAPWSLTETLDSDDLYRALFKKFGAPPANGNATIYHVLTLAVQGKSQEAVKAAANLNGASIESAASQATQAGYGMQVYDFLHELLQQHPDSGDWKTYVQLAAQTGHAADALQFVQDSLARKDLSDAAQANIQRVLYRALLSVDKVDEGIKELRGLIANAKATPVAANPYSYPDPASNAVEWDIQLARIGQALKRDDLIEEGLKDARNRQPKDALIPYLIETGRNAEAEKMLVDAIVSEATREAANPNYGIFGGYSANQQNLVRLAQVYYNAGRWVDILTLLEQVPGWGTPDLLGITEEKAYTERFTPPSVGLMAARALSETGRMDEARKVLDYTLQVDAGDDGVYELLLKIGQGDLVAKLDALYKQDQFENRPLIWKATLLLQQGKVAEAEAACKAAIAVDPSDGETGKGNRMRVYSVMAEVCEAKKDTAQATFFHNVVKAIRLSENADDFYDAGLLTHAVRMYAQALDLFSDAYCIQSRIARQLAELGRMEEAAVHYRKAFELMPVSFGRMESHCFGCEGAFEGKTAAEIAEKTFTDMLAKDPTKPQLSYLLGYLYKEEEKYAMAVPRFQKAAELDPDYINAWKQISEIGDSYQLSPSVRDAAVFNILRLDPAGHHITPQTENVRDLAKLWEVETTCVRSLPPVPTTLLPLTASAAHQADAMARWEKMIPAGFDHSLISYYESQMNRPSNAPKDATSARTAVIGNGLLALLIGMFR